MTDFTEEALCKELDKLSGLGYVASYKQNFKNRLLQRKENEMTLDEALKAI